MDGAALFANYCERCHETNEIVPSLSGTSDADLVKFIAGHNTGRELNAAQRAALATYFKVSCGDDG
jgi:mono/diheme cytochrome c family protein